MTERYVILLHEKMFFFNELLYIFDRLVTRECFLHFSCCTKFVDRNRLSTPRNITIDSKDKHQRVEFKIIGIKLLFVDHQNKLMR